MLFDELSSEDKNKFDAKSFKEIDNMSQLAALSVMNVNDSEHFVKTRTSHRRMFDKWQRQDDGTPRAGVCWYVGKIQWSPVGARCTHTDSRGHHGDFITLLASAKVSGKVTDLTNAFGQSRKTSRWS